MYHLSSITLLPEWNFLGKDCFVGVSELHKCGAFQGLPNGEIPWGSTVRSGQFKNNIYISLWLLMHAMVFLVERGLRTLNSFSHNS